MSLAAELRPPGPTAVAAALLESLARVRRCGPRLAQAELCWRPPHLAEGPGAAAVRRRRVAQVAAGEVRHARSRPRARPLDRPAAGRIHVHNMGEAPAVGDPRPAASRPATFRDQVGPPASCTISATRTRRSLVTPGDVPAQLHPLDSYFAIAARRKSPSGDLGRTTPGRCPCSSRMATAALGARPGGAPADGTHWRWATRRSARWTWVEASATASSRRRGSGWASRC